MEFTLTQTADPIKDHGLKASSMAKVFSKHLKDHREKEYGKRVREYNGSTSNNQARTKIWKWPNDKSNCVKFLLVGNNINATLTNKLKIHFGLTIFVKFIFKIFASKSKINKKN